MSLVAEGTHKASMTESGVGESSQNTPYIYTMWLLESGETRTVYSYLSDAAWEMSVQKLETLGFNGSFNEPAFTVTETELVCKHEEWEGKTREKWDLANWGGDREKKELSKDKIRLLNAKWKRDAGSSAPPPAAKKESEEDILAARTKAWDTFTEADAYKDKERGDQIIDWAMLLRDIAPKKEESEFTVDDWKRVEAHARF